jgi:aminoglycoside phosphotransferase (APT) family kinase protein
MAPKKVGQELGAVRSSLPLDKLEPYLEKNVKGYHGPLEVQQFKFGQVSLPFCQDT